MVDFFYSYLLQHQKATEYFYPACFFLSEKYCKIYTIYLFTFDFIYFICKSFTSNSFKSFTYFSFHFFFSKIFLVTTFLLFCFGSFGDLITASFVALFTVSSSRGSCLTLTVSAGVWQCFKIFSINFSSNFHSRENGLKLKRIYI